jgi:hypothetical protein
MSISGPNWPYDYKAEKERHMSKELSLSDDLRKVANDMERVADRMMLASHIDDTPNRKRLWQHGIEMLGASDIARVWAKEIEKETEK